MRSLVFLTALVSRSAFTMSAFSHRSTARSARTLVDFDANLLHEQLVDDIDYHILQAQDHDVNHFVVPGSTLEDSKLAIELSAARPKDQIIATAGVHPYHVNEMECNEEAVQKLEQLLGITYEATDKKEGVDIVVSEVEGNVCKAVGECGLDYSKGFPEKELQLPWFHAQISLALKYSLPLFLHVRDAREDFVEIIGQYGFSQSSPPPVKGCVHCFTGDVDELQQYVNMGFYIGLTGYIITANMKDTPSETTPEISKLKEWLDIIPEDKLVIETDAPYMGFKGCRSIESKRKNQKYPNIPAALTQICQIIADAKGVSYDEIATSTTNNALEFFR